MVHRFHWLLRHGGLDPESRKWNQGRAGKPPSCDLFEKDEQVIYEAKALHEVTCKTHPTGKRQQRPSEIARKIAEGISQLGYYAELESEAQNGVEIKKQRLLVSEKLDLAMLYPRDRQAIVDGLVQVVEFLCKCSGEKFEQGRCKCKPLGF
jgi:hypothetical protein